MIDELLLFSFKIFFALYNNGNCICVGYFSKSNDAPNSKFI